MPLSGFQNNLLENWTGANLLQRSWLTPSDYHSASRVSIQPITSGKFLTFVIFAEGVEELAVQADYKREQ